MSPWKYMRDTYAARCGEPPTWQRRLLHPLLTVGLIVRWWRGCARVSLFSLYHTLGYAS
jgi:hypothetical protein